MPSHLFSTGVERRGRITHCLGLYSEAEGRADMVALARALLANPRWPWRASAAPWRGICAATSLRPLRADDDGLGGAVRAEKAA